MRRRDLLMAGAGAVTLANSSRAEPPADAMCKKILPETTFVLVHGANHGGWCWRDVRKQLREQNYEVFTPTLTGLGDRSHLVSPNIGLQDHVTDIVNLILAEELQDFILVGHSYGGTVVSGVCDQLRDRIRAVVFLDANTPANGEPTIPGLTPEVVEQALGQPLQDGYLVPPMEPLRLGISPDDAENYAWVKRRMTGQPIKTLSDPLQLRNGGTDGMNRTFVLTTRKEQLQPFALKRLLEIDQDPTWQYRELLVGHDAMVIAPCAVANMLAELAAGKTT
jgi:pimeloyl-ACP methyl ester carboxylesterase